MNFRQIILCFRAKAKPTPVAEPTPEPPAAPSVPEPTIVPPVTDPTPFQPVVEPVPFPTVSTGSASQLDTEREKVSQVTKSSKLATDTAGGTNNLPVINEESMSNLATGMGRVSFSSGTSSSSQHITPSQAAGIIQVTNCYSPLQL